MTVPAGIAAPAEFRAALRRVDLRLRLAVEEMREELVRRANDPFRGLYISEPEVEDILGSIQAESADHLLATPAADTAPRLRRLAGFFRLDEFEQEALLICLAPEIDLRYERLYGYLQDDVTKRRPTVDLILRLLGPSLEERAAARRALGPGGLLFREGLLGLGDEAAAKWPLLARPLRIDERIVEYLLGSDVPDSRIYPFAELVPAQDGGRDPALLLETAENLVRLLKGNAAEGTPGLVIYLHGPLGTAKAATARAACAAASLPSLIVDISALASVDHSAAQLSMAAREALLQDAVLVLDGIDPLLTDDAALLPLRNMARRAIQGRPRPTILLGEARWEPAVWLREGTAARVELPALGPGARVRLWRAHANGQLPAEETDDLAARFRLDGDAVRAVAAAARSQAIWRGDGKVSSEDFRSAARAIATPPLEGLARRIEPRYGWDDIILPQDSLARLRELSARARYQTLVLEGWGFGRKHARRTGLTALFTGQPGTGKTMAAEIVAGDLGMDLYRIDLSAVVSKYIGETEKNLERIFRAADMGDAVLLFDEADALFGKRSEVRDAHDRYANVEVAYLLQRLEAYDGLAILTTNLRGNVDEAFMRRLDLVLEFPMPEEAERLAIWRRALPPEAPLAEAVDLPFLARKFKLAGGHIRNIALAAGFLAAADGGPIAMKHLVRATRREHQKLGKLVGEADFEDYRSILSESGIRG